MAAVLKLNDVCREYQRGNVPFFAVNHVSLSIEAGDFLNIIGRSGSGKSTLLNIAAGMLSPTSGSVELDGENLAGKDDATLSRLRNDKIGFVPQGASALPNLTILENVVLPFCLWPHGGDGEGAARLLLERFGISHLADSYPSELSGGELRRALIARALINRPRIVIADEPTSDLDVESSINIMEAFAKLNSEGVTLLLVSHDLDMLKFGKRVCTMSDGHLMDGNHLTDGQNP
ncbi:MAG: ABC transporter ATP-binding protein [Fretibacterium sp.]|nr:ABC transporter ATP-binding protein [Fretibacterium sp.]